jgi:hypothetical protein
MSSRLKVLLSESLMYYTRPPTHMRLVCGWVQESVLPLYDVNESIFKVSMLLWIVFRYAFQLIDGETWLICCSMHTYHISMPMLSVSS